MSDISTFDEHIQFIQSQTNKALVKIVPKSNLSNYFYDPINFVLKGKGKRLRPVLVHLSGQVYNAHPDDLMKLGIAVELLHNFSLVHDDIMDSDSVRHGQPTVHNKWDIPTAILAGDGLFTLAQLALVGLDGYIFQRFNEVALDVCEGQGMDKEYENDHSIEMDDYIQMIGKKTACFLGMCSELGSVLGSASKDEAENLYKFGYFLGLAFQIKDDYLEIFSSEESMGKSLGSDIDENKQTILALVARKIDTKGWTKFLNKQRSFDEYKDYFKTSGVKSEVEKLIKLNVEKALSGLNMIPVKKSIQLENYAKLILNREF
jgi:geranylgeranyl diphosphate synthase type II